MVLHSSFLHFPLHCRLTRGVSSVIEKDKSVGGRGEGSRHVQMGVHAPTRDMGILFE